MHSKFIVLEGIDGSGKSSAVLRLVEYLNKNHCPTLHTYEPYGSFITSTIYDVLYNRIPQPDPRVMATLFTAARMHHIDRVIRPALSQGLNVVCDRYIFSTFAYNTSPETSKDYVENIHVEFYLPPDHIFYLYCDAYTALERKKATKDKKSIFDTDLDKLKDVYNEYQTLFYGRETVEVCGQESKVHVIDANKYINNTMKQIINIIDMLIVKPFPIEKK